MPLVACFFFLANAASLVTFFPFAIADFGDPTEAKPRAGVQEAARGWGGGGGGQHSFSRVVRRGGETGSENTPIMARKSP